MNRFEDPRHPRLSGLPIDPASLDHSIALESLEEQVARPRPVPTSAPWRAQGTARYQLLERVGRGVSGTVYKALDRKLDRVVALKRLDRGGRSASERRLMREIQGAGRLSHPNVVTLFDWGADRHGPFLTFQWIPGPTLAAHLAGGALTVPEALRLARQIGDALSHAHRHGVLHRDVKPANVLLAHDDRGELTAMLADFGLAAASGSLASGANLAGTFPYIAPEVAARQPADHRADLYSLSVTIVQMLTGRLPADLEAVPAPLRGPLARGLAPAPADRFFSVNELLDALVTVGQSPARANVAPEPPAAQRSDAVRRRAPAPPRDRRCPGCRIQVPAGRPFCPTCGMNLDRFLKIRSFLAQQQIKYLWGQG